MFRTWTTQITSQWKVLQNLLVITTWFVLWIFFFLMNFSIREVFNSLTVKNTCRSNESRTILCNMDSIKYMHNAAAKTIIVPNTFNSSEATTQQQKPNGTRKKRAHGSRFQSTIHRGKKWNKDCEKIRYHYIPNKTFSAACAVPLKHWREKRHEFNSILT